MPEFKTFREAWESFAAHTLEGENLDEPWRQVERHAVTRQRPRPPVEGKGAEPHLLPSLGLGAWGLGAWGLKCALLISAS